MGKAIRYFQATRRPSIPGQSATSTTIDHVLEIEDILIVLYADGTVEYEWAERMDEIGLRVAGLQTALPENTQSTLGARWNDLPDPNPWVIEIVRSYLIARDQLAERKPEVSRCFPTLSPDELEVLAKAVEDERE